MRDTSRDKFSICGKCGDRITLRLPGSSVWKLDSTFYKDNAKHSHEPTFIFESSYDTRKIDKQATKIYWRDGYDKKKIGYYSARKICIELACDELGYIAK